MTEGRRALLAVLQITKGRFVAARVPCARSRVSEWASGRTTPSARARAKLFASYGIAPESWDIEVNRSNEVNRGIRARR